MDAAGPSKDRAADGARPAGEENRQVVVTEEVDAATPPDPRFRAMGTKMAIDDENQRAMWAWNGLDSEELHMTFLSGLPENRKRLGLILSASWCEIALCLVILFNGVIAILETDATADGDDAPDWISAVNIGLLLVYTTEILLRVYVYHWYYFRSSWNWLDLSVVGLDIILNLLRGIFGKIPNVSVLRTLRLLRLARAYRVIVLFPELHVMIMGMAGTIKTVLWGLILLCGFLAVFSLIAVQVIHPINKRIDWVGCPRCERAFGSVWDASVTFTQQIIAGDSWGLVTLPIIEEEPWTVAYFLIVLVTINLLVINLILAVVVDKAQQARAKDQAEVVKQVAAEKEAHQHKARTELVKMCYSMDTDKSGCLTIDELLAGYDTDEYFQNSLKAIDIDREDISMVFNILDKDGSGDIDYSEFVEQLHKLKSQDTHTLLIFVLHHVKELESMLANGESRRLRTPSTAASDPDTNGSSTSRDQDIENLARMIEEADALFDSQAKLMNAISEGMTHMAMRHGTKADSSRPAPLHDGDDGSIYI